MKRRVWSAGATLLACALKTPTAVESVEFFNLVTRGSPRASATRRRRSDLV